LLKSLDGAGAFGDYCWDSASQRLDDDQAIRLGSGWEHQQVGRIPFLVERLALQRAGHPDPLPQSCRRDLGTQPSGILRISPVGAD
jgi:hypothetical protein